MPNPLESTWHSPSTSSAEQPALQSSWLDRVEGVAQKYRKELETAGIVVLGSVAVVGLHQAGAFEQTAALIKGALKFGDSSAAVATSTAAERAAFLEKASVLRGVDTYMFDLDNTLIDTNKGLASYTGAMQQELVRATKLPPNVVQDALAQTHGELHSKFFARRLDLIKPLQELFPGEDLNAKFPTVAKKAEAAYREAIQPSKETLDMLDSLKQANKRLVMFTAGAPMQTAIKLDETGLAPYFDKVFTAAKNPFEDSAASGLTASAENSAKLNPLMVKPKIGTAGYEHIIDQLNLTPSKTLMTGDNIAEDVWSGKTAGLKTAWATWYAKTGTADVIPDLVLTNQSELTALEAASRK